MNQALLVSPAILNLAVLLGTIKYSKVLRGPNNPLVDDGWFGRDWWLGRDWWFGRDWWHSPVHNSASGGQELWDGLRL